MAESTYTVEIGGSAVVVTGTLPATCRCSSRRGITKMYDNYTNGAMDEAMVDVVSEEMRKKLRLKRRDGRSGWFKPEVSSEKLWRNARGARQKT